MCAGGSLDFGFLRQPSVAFGGLRLIPTPWCVFYVSLLRLSLFYFICFNFFLLTTICASCSLSTINKDDDMMMMMMMMIESGLYGSKPVPAVPSVPRYWWPSVNSERRRYSSVTLWPSSTTVYELTYTHWLRHRQDNSAHAKPTTPKP